MRVKAREIEIVNVGERRKEKYFVSESEREGEGERERGGRDIYI